MNYSKSKQILERIKKADRILLNCHMGPDPDSIGSALAMYQVLKKMRKHVRIICPTEVVDYVAFLKHFDKIEKVNFSTIDYSDFDLFILLDTSTWNFASGKESPRPNIFTIVIDHHKTNLGYGDMNLLDKKISSAGEILYSVFEDWGVKIDKDIATSLLAGIIGDTGVFRFPGVSPRTLEIAGKLIKKGADKDGIIFNLCFSIEFNQFKFWGEALSNLQLDKKHRFAWIAIPYEVYIKYGGKKGLKESTATKFAQSIKGSNFGIIMVEEEKEKLDISLRSRTGLDVSQIALELGGGGHQYAAGGGVKGLPFDKAVEKVLQIARKFARKSKK